MDLFSDHEFSTKEKALLIDDSLIRCDGVLPLLA